MSRSGSGLTPAGIVVGAQGVRGLVRLKTFTETPSGIADYGPLYNESGDRHFQVTLIEARPTVAVVKIDGVTSREAAEALKGLMLHIQRSVLPEVDEDEFYHADLVGLIAETEAEGRIGVVFSLDNFGAGELIEIALDTGGAPLVCPFTTAVVPVIDIAGGKVLLNPPVGLWPRKIKAKHTGPAKSGKRKRPRPVEGDPA